MKISKNQFYDKFKHIFIKCLKWKYLHFGVTVGGKSSSESSELRPGCGLSVTTGRRICGGFKCRGLHPLFLLWLWCFHRVGSLFRADWNWCGDSCGGPRVIWAWESPFWRFSNWCRRRITHSWCRSQSYPFGMVVTLSFPWCRDNRKRAKVWFWIDHHVCRDAPMRHHCRRCWWSRHGDYECVKNSCGWVWVANPRGMVM